MFVPTSRIIRYQHRQHGVVHLASVRDTVHHSAHYGANVLHTTPVWETLCGQKAYAGGWGHDGKPCPRCHKYAATADPLPR